MTNTDSSEGAEESFPKWSLRAWIELAGVLVVLVGFASSFTIAQYQINELQKSYAVLDSRTAADHDTLVEMKNDVRWIRQTLERGTK